MCGLVSLILSLDLIKIKIGNTFSAIISVLLEELYVNSKLDLVSTTERYV